MRGPGREVLELGEFRGVVAGAETLLDEAWEPRFLALLPGERPALESVCRERGIHLVDRIRRQLRDLAAVRLPAGDDGQRGRWVEDRIREAGDADAVGRWVHLPWLRTVVHLLEEDDYFDVITDRNRDKITREEQRSLRAKRVGVVGLSVGGEAAVTVAQEHLCGEMVLADFDGLDLSNLNRLGAGVDDLGRNKAVLVARRIVRLNPYLRLRVLTEGVHDENLDGFLDGLDLLVEECDGLAMKHRIREEARLRRLNIVFAGDERGFLSVEPYGLWPGLEPFHGRVREPQRSREEHPDALSFMKELTVWLGGWDAISDRSRASLAELGTRLNGYPQLAGEARYAAGQLAHVARRLLLGERLPPFVGHLDLDEMLPTARADEP